MKVTAIIPAYNAEIWIEEAIRSVQAQKAPVHELIVVDDGSGDETGRIAHSLGADVITLAENSGEGFARNAGLARATGDSIAWLDADDYWAPDHVEVLAGLLDRYAQASVACAAVQLFGLRSNVNTGYAPVEEPGNLFWTAAKDWLHPIIGAMMRTEALRDIGGFATDLKYSVDYDMWLRLSRNHTFIATRQVTSFWRWHSQQQSSMYDKQLAAAYFFRRRYLDIELIGKSPDDAEKFAANMRKMWNKDFYTAFENDDISLCTSILEIGGLIPNLESADIRRRRVELETLRLTLPVGRPTDG